MFVFPSYFISPIKTPVQCYSSCSSGWKHLLGPSTACLKAGAHDTDITFVSLWKITLFQKSDHPLDEISSVTAQDGLCCCHCYDEEGAEERRCPRKPKAVTAHGLLLRICAPGGTSPWWLTHHKPHLYQPSVPLEIRQSVQAQDRALRHENLLIF